MEYHRSKNPGMLQKQYIGYKCILSAEREMEGERGKQRGKGERGNIDHKNWILVYLLIIPLTVRKN